MEKKMNILYGVAGVGFGHASRAATIIEYLQSKGHSVKVLTYGQGYKALKNKFDVFKVRGPDLIFAKGILKKRKTIKANTKIIQKNIFGWRKFRRLIKEFHPDLCITDMDPIVPILQNWYNLPLFSIDNQHCITNLEFKVPTNYYKEYLIAKSVVDTFVREADAFIVTSFVSFPTTKKNTFVVSPIIREDVRKLKPTTSGPIIVYLSRKDKKTLAALQEIPKTFLIYGYNKTKRKNNLQFRKKETFLEDLKNCEAVIGTAGFTLMTEAIYLKKPYLALPLKGQFEQMLNAVFIKKAGFGEYSESLTSEEIKNFLNNVKKYKSKLDEYNPDYNKLFKVLDAQLRKIEK
jgi:uncharacterized protein (TIGR00661 family)